MHLRSGKNISVPSVVPRRPHCDGGGTPSEVRRCIQQRKATAARAGGRGRMRSGCAGPCGRTLQARAIIRQLNAEMLNTPRNTVQITRSTITKVSGAWKGGGRLNDGRPPQPGTQSFSLFFGIRARDACRALGAPRWACGKQRQERPSAPSWFVSASRCIKFPR